MVKVPYTNGHIIQLLSSTSSIVRGDGKRVVMTSTRCVVSLILSILHLDSVSQGDIHRASTRRRELVNIECLLLATLEMRRNIGY